MKWCIQQSLDKGEGDQMNHYKHFVYIFRLKKKWNWSSELHQQTLDTWFLAATYNSHGSIPKLFWKITLAEVWRLENKIDGSKWYWSQGYFLLNHYLRLWWKQWNKHFLLPSLSKSKQDYGFNSTFSHWSRALCICSVIIGNSRILQDRPNQSPHHCQESFFYQEMFWSFYQWNDIDITSTDCTDNLTEI